MMRKTMVRALCVFTLFLIYNPLAQAEEAGSVKVDLVDTDQFEEHGLMRFYVDILNSQGEVPERLDPENIWFEIDGEPTAGPIELKKLEDEDQGTAVLLMLPATGALVTGGDGPNLFKQMINGAVDFLDDLGPYDYHAVSIYNETGIIKNYDFVGSQDINVTKRSLVAFRNDIVLKVSTGEIKGSGTESPRLLGKYIKEILKDNFRASELPDRKVVLLVTDGTDLSDETKRGEDGERRWSKQRTKMLGVIAKEANREPDDRNNSKIKIHVIGIPGFAPDDDHLATFIAIAGRTKGTALTVLYKNDEGIERPEDFQEVADSFDVMKGRILGQHIIEWKPDDWDGGEGEIRLTIKMSGREIQAKAVEGPWPERPSNWVGTFFTIFFWLLGIALFIFILMKILNRRKNQPVEEEYYGDTSLGARAVLLVVGGPNQGEEIYLSDEVTTFGRSDACEVQLDDPTMSRRHAAIRIDSMRFELSDIKSASGTFVNGRRIEKCFLKDGDLVMLAETKLSFKLLS